MYLPISQDVIHQVELFLKSTYTQTHFPDQKLDWNTHPDNIGHKNSPGCFRCHDGKHISAAGNPVRLECNLCHSVPQKADPSKFVTTVSIVRGAEPGSHTHSAWIALHGKAVDQTCARCHPPKDPNTGLDPTERPETARATAPSAAIRPATSRCGSMPGLDRPTSKRCSSSSWRM